MLRGLMIVSLVMLGACSGGPEATSAAALIEPTTELPPGNGEPNSIPLDSPARSGTVKGGSTLIDVAFQDERLTPPNITAFSSMSRGEALVGYSSASEDREVVYELHKFESGVSPMEESDVIGTSNALSIETDALDPGGMNWLAVRAVDADGNFQWSSERVSYYASSITLQAAENIVEASREVIADDFVVGGDGSAAGESLNVGSLYIHRDLLPESAYQPGAVTILDFTLDGETGSLPITVECCLGDEYVRIEVASLPQLLGSHEYALSLETDDTVSDIAAKVSNVFGKPGQFTPLQGINCEASADTSIDNFSASFSSRGAGATVNLASGQGGEDVDRSFLSLAEYGFNPTIQLFAEASSASLGGSVACSAETGNIDLVLVKALVKSVASTVARKLGRDKEIKFDFGLFLTFEYGLTLSFEGTFVEYSDEWSVFATTSAGLRNDETIEGVSTEEKTSLGAGDVTLSDAGLSLTHGLTAVIKAGFELPGFLSGRLSPLGSSADLGVYIEPRYSVSQTTYTATASPSGNPTGFFYVHPDFGRTGDELPFSGEGRLSMDIGGQFKAGAVTSRLVFASPELQGYNMGVAEIEVMSAGDVSDEVQAVIAPGELYVKARMSTLPTDPSTDTILGDFDAGKASLRTVPDAEVELVDQSDGQLIYRVTGVPGQLYDLLFEAGTTRPVNLSAPGQGNALRDQPDQIGIYCREERQGTNPEESSQLNDKMVESFDLTLDPSRYLGIISARGIPCGNTFDLGESETFPHPADGSTVFLGAKKPDGWGFDGASFVHNTEELENRRAAQNEAATGTPQIRYEYTTVSGGVVRLENPVLISDNRRACNQDRSLLCGRQFYEVDLSLEHTYIRESINPNGPDSSANYFLEARHRLLVAVGRVEYGDPDTGVRGISSIFFEIPRQ